MYPGAMGMPDMQVPTKQPDPNCMSFITISPEEPSLSSDDVTGIQLLDWFCILQRTFRLTFNTVAWDSKLDFYNGDSLDLNRDQTKHLARYLNDLDQNGVMLMGPYGNRSPKVFLALPMVQALINEED